MGASTRHQNRPEVLAEYDSIDAYLADNIDWQISAKGNAWTTWNDQVITVFKRPTGIGYAVCVAGQGGPTFWKQTWKSRKAARRAVEKWIRKAQHAKKENTEDEA